MANTVNVTKANTFEEWRVKTNEIGTAIGDLDTLTSADSGATTIVAALNVRDTEVEANTALIGTDALWDAGNTYVTLRKAINKNHADVETIASTLGIGSAFSLSGYDGDETQLVAILDAQYAFDGGKAGATNMTTTAQTLAPAIEEVHGEVNTVNTKLGTISAAAMGTTASTVGPAILELHGELTTATSNIAGIGAAYVAVAGDTLTGLLTVREASGASPGIRAATALTLGAGSGTTMTMNASQRLGIGAAPHATHKVDVNGNLNATTLSYGGTDLATKFVTAGEVFEDTVGAMFTGSTQTGGISATYDDANGEIDLAIAANGHSHVVANVTDFDAGVKAIINTITTGGVESGIDVSYNTGTSKLDFNLNDPDITLTGAVTGTATMTNLGNVTIATVSGVGNVITADIADGAVTTIKIADDAVTGAKIADDAIDSNHYAADSIDEEHMADDAIGSVQMKSLSTLLIINSAGTTVKTLHGAGA